MTKWCTLWPQNKLLTHEWRVEWRVEIHAIIRLTTSCGGVLGSGSGWSWAILTLISTNIGSLDFCWDAKLPDTPRKNIFKFSISSIDIMDFHTSNHSQSKPSNNPLSAYFTQNQNQDAQLFATKIWPWLDESIVNKRECLGATDPRNQRRCSHFVINRWCKIWAKHS